MVMIMKKTKQMVEDILAGGACLISVAVLFREIFQWMLYV